MNGFHVALYGFLQTLIYDRERQRGGAASARLSQSLCFIQTAVYYGADKC